MLASSLESPQETVAYWACKLLGRTDHVAQCQAQLRKILSTHPSVEIRQIAIKTLSKIDSLEAESLNALHEVVATGEASLQRLAGQSISQMPNR
jgi:hypothetical protein